MPTAAFFSPFGSERYGIIRTDRQTFRWGIWTDRHLVRVFGQRDRHSYGFVDMLTYYKKNFFVRAPIITKILLLSPLCPKESKYVLRYEIGLLEVGQKNEHTYRHTDRQTDREWQIII